MTILISKYENKIKHGRTIFIAGVPMLFEKVDYAIPLGIIMMILGVFIIKYYNKLILHEKNKTIIIDFLEELINKIPIKNKKIIEKEPKIIKIKEIKVINTFGKKYQYNNTININNININNNNVDKIMYYDITYDKITLFLDIFMFVSKFKNIMDLKLKCYNNQLLIDYYNHYYKLISYISNIDILDKLEISNALTTMEEDYYDNMKILDKLIRDILIEENKEDWINNNNTIKLINSVLNNIIIQNLKKFDINCELWLK